MGKQKCKKVKKRKSRAKGINPVGRPPMFKTAEELQNKVDEYFETGRNVRKIVEGTGTKLRTTDVAIITITGLALYLGFCDRQSLYDMQELPKFTCTIKKARCRVERNYEELAQVNSNPAGPIFALKNMGWRDRTEQVHGISDSLASLMKEIGSNGNGLPIKT